MTQDEIIEMAREAGFERLGHTDEDWVCYPEDIEAFANLVAAKEREACAKVCESYIAQGIGKEMWVGLTTEEWKEISMVNRPYVVDMVVALEARLKQKNGYAEENT